MKRAVALVAYRDEHKDQVLSVLRPEDDEDHPGMWGLPATSLKEDESWEEAVHRAADEKLGIDVAIKELLSEGAQTRERYDIVLRNYEVEITAGKPDVDQKDVYSTKYDDWGWKPVEKMLEIAENGDSLCTSLLLSYHDYQFDSPENITSMEHF